jgi:hypothetical protein
MLKFIFILLLVLPSCLVLDYPNRMAGFSNRKFQNKKTIFSKKFDFDSEEIFKKIIFRLSKLHARIVRKSFNKNYIIAFDFSKSFDYCLDSTEVAFFIKEGTAEKNVQLEIVSNNTILAKEVADKIFELLLKTDEEIEEEEKKKEEEKRKMIEEKTEEITSPAQPIENNEDIVSKEEKKERTEGIMYPTQSVENNKTIVTKENETTQGIEEQEIKK